MVKATFDLAQIDRTGLTHIKELDNPTSISKCLRAGTGPNIWKFQQKEDPTIRKVKGLVKRGQFDTYRVDLNEKGEICTYTEKLKRSSDPA